MPTLAPGNYGISLVLHVIETVWYDSLARASGRLSFFTKSSDSRKFENFDHTLKLGVSWWKLHRIHAYRICALLRIESARASVVGIKTEASTWDSCLPCLFLCLPALIVIAVKCIVWDNIHLVNSLNGNETLSFIHSFIHSCIFLCCFTSVLLRCVYLHGSWNLTNASDVSAGRHQMLLNIWMSVLL